MCKIPEFKRSDFEGVAPYAWLCDHAFESSFERSQAERAMAAAAIECGYKHFPASYKEYKSEIAKNDLDDHPSDMTDFGLPIEPMYCGKYNCTQYGITIDIKGEPTIVITHPLWIERIMRNMESNTVKVELGYYINGRIEKVSVAKSVLSSNQKITQLSDYGIRATSENARLLINYLSTLETLNEDRITHETCVGRLGWIGDDWQTFSPYTDELSYDGTTSDGAAKIYKSFNEPHGDRSQWFEIIDYVRADASVAARMALATSFAAPIVAPVGGLNFITHLNGLSSTGKTVALYLAASVWCDPQNSGFVKSFNSTRNGWELYPSFCGSVPIIFDESQMARDELDGIVYTLCEGISRVRGSKDGGMQRPKEWKTSVLTSGEIPLSSSSSGTGAIARVISVQYGSEKLFGDRAEYVANGCKEHFGHAGREWVQWISGHIDRIRECYKTYRSKIPKDVQDKQAMSAAILLTADRCYAECFGLDTGFCLQVEDILKYVVDKESSNINYRCWNWLWDTIAANPARFLQSVDDNKGEVWGMKEYDGSDEQVLVKVYFNQTVISREMDKARYNFKDFYKWGLENGHIEPDPDGVHKGQRKTVGGVSGRRYIVILPDSDMKTTE